MKVSIICVYNNEQQLEQQLKASLKKQNIRYEFIGINNTKNVYSSAVKALNDGASHATGDVLVFSHQDILLKTQNELNRFACFISNEPKETIVGVAGALEKHKQNVGNYTSGIEINEEQIYKFNSPMEVSCVDECFFGMKRSTYEMHPFDEVICNDWHLYAVEQCLYHRMKGGKVYVFPLQVHHSSKGNISLAYMNGLVRLADEYRKDLKYIWTTCYKVKTNYIYIRTLRGIWIINRKLKSIFGFGKRKISRIRK